MIHVFLVGIGGLFGSITRFHISIKTNKRMLGTWIANMTGSIFLAIIVHSYLSEWIGERLWLLLGVGFCGAYTTFSTFGHEMLQLLLGKKYKGAIIYGLSSITLSLIPVVFILSRL